MPGTSLYEKTKLHRDFFMISKVLRKNTRILPKVIEDFRKEIDYDEKENKSSFLSEISEYILDDNIEDPNKLHTVLIQKYYYHHVCIRTVCYGRYAFVFGYLA